MPEASYCWSWIPFSCPYLFSFEHFFPLRPYTIFQLSCITLVIAQGAVISWRDFGCFGAHDLGLEFQNCHLNKPSFFITVLAQDISLRSLKTEHYCGSIGFSKRFSSLFPQNFSPPNFPTGYVYFYCCDFAVSILCLPHQGLVQEGGGAEALSLLFCISTCLQVPFLFPFCGKWFSWNHTNVWPRC